MKNKNLPTVNPKFMPEMPEVKQPYKPFNFPSSEFRDPNEGWICPRCGTCWNPDMAHCTCVENEDIPESLRVTPSKTIRESEEPSPKSSERIEK